MDKPLNNPQVQATIRYPAVPSFAKGELGSMSETTTTPAPQEDGGASNPKWEQDLILDYLDKDKAAEGNKNKERCYCSHPESKCFFGGDSEEIKERGDVKVLKFADR